MNLKKLIKLAENYDEHVIYSPLNMYVKFGCDCGCGGDLYTSDEWDKVGELHDVHLAAWEKACDSLGLSNKADELYPALIAYTYSVDHLEDDPELEDIVDYIIARRTLERLLAWPLK